MLNWSPLFIFDSIILGGFNKISFFNDSISNFMSFPPMFVQPSKQINCSQNNSRNYNFVLICNKHFVFHHHCKFLIFRNQRPELYFQSTSAYLEIVWKTLLPTAKFYGFKVKAILLIQYLLSSFFEEAKARYRHFCLQLVSVGSF